jgi:hypothetical protein
LGTGASPAKRNATPYTGETSAFAVATNLTAGGAVTTITGNSSAVVPITTTQAELQFSWTPVGTAGAVDTIQIDDVQVESQLSATTWTPTNFDRTPFARQFSACQRHYFKTFPYATSVGQSTTVQNSVQIMAQVANVSVGINWQFPVRLRATASITTYSPGGATANWYNIDTSASVAVTADPHATLNDANIFISGVSVSAVGQEITIHITASAGI